MFPKIEYAQGSVVQNKVYLFLLLIQLARNLRNLNKITYIKGDQNNYPTASQITINNYYDSKKNEAKDVFKEEFEDLTEEVEEEKEDEEKPPLPSMISDDELRKKIELVRPRIVQKRHLFPVLRYMMWHKVVARATLEQPWRSWKLGLDLHDMQRLYCLSFMKTLDLWDIGNAPVAGRRIFFCSSLQRHSVEN